MSNTRTTATATRTNTADPTQVADTFKASVIDKISIRVGTRSYNYAEYLNQPGSLRSNDEADAVDQQFALYTLEWLGFTSGDWNYNRPVAGSKADRPDYKVAGSIGTAFIWEDKNSTHGLEDKDIAQMRRYSAGTAGYAVWCNMQRILAVRFLATETLKYETLADVRITELFGPQLLLDESLKEAQAINLALFKLLFSKDRFTRFADLAKAISIDEPAFLAQARSLDTDEALNNFISGSQEALAHLRLAALARIREAFAQQDRLKAEEQALRSEWEAALKSLLDQIRFNVDQVRNAVEALPWGDSNLQQIRAIEDVIKAAEGRNLQISIRPTFERWVERALHINNAVSALHFQVRQDFGTAEAYEVWSNRQSDAEDINPETFAEQVGYVFFVRLLLVRVLEDKKVLRPRLASDGGFTDWTNYVESHFQEVNGIGLLSDTYYDLLTRKAGYYYLHFFQQPVFDWFRPDDFLLIETLEFLSRYNFRDVSSDIIGFTYEQYIDRNARNRKGHFLTRPEIVEYMLDILHYAGRQVLGRNILDPACGSGSFLVHAARRYRNALIESLCDQHNLPDEAAILTDPKLRISLASENIKALSSLFFGMELNPFACYLAEMNLLIQGLDDLFVLQQADEPYSLERFHIYNTDSLNLPREVLDNPDPTGISNIFAVPDRLSDRLLDEAYRIKARISDYAQGFFYVILNPPYVTSKQEELDTGWIKNTEFYKIILSGDTNLYLLFLRLGLYYLAGQGQMVYIVPLTVFGDESAGAARLLFTTSPFTPAATIRFYRGNVLFPGVDQAVGIIRVNRAQANDTMIVSGGDNVREARAAQFTSTVSQVAEAVPRDPIWHGSWLVSNSPISIQIWEHAKVVSSGASLRLNALLDSTFDMKQGDVNATEVNFARVRPRGESFTASNVAIYKGEDVQPFAPLPADPSDWASTTTSGTLTTNQRRVLRELQRLKTLASKEKGLVRREVARLNTRERLIATWFEREATSPIAFTHETWRMLLRPSVSEQKGKALLALLSSKPIAYLLNLFSTNNHVSKDELGRVPIPDPATFPEARLAALANSLLTERANLHTEYVEAYDAQLPDYDDGTVYIPPSSVLSATPVSKLTLSALVARGEVRNLGQATGRIRSLVAGNRIVSTLTETDTIKPFATTLDLFLHEPNWQGETWLQAQSRQLPDPAVVAAWLRTYNDVQARAQASWNNFIDLQRQVDEEVANWYGFEPAMRSAIAEGLPWARRRGHIAPA